MLTFKQFCREEDERTYTNPSVSTIRRRALIERKEERQGWVLSEIESFTASVLNSPFVPEAEKRQALTARLLAKLVAEGHHGTR